MRRFFLVDYENVSDGGLHGFFDLTGDDTVALFYTQNANKISIDFFEIAMRSDKAADIAFIKVNPGNQALDLQLASYLGALMASAEDDCAFYIVSKDKGFQCLIPFWSAHHGGTPLYQVRSIQEAIQPDGTATAEVKPARAARPQQKPVPQPAKQPEKTPEPQPEAVAEAEAVPVGEDKPQPPAPESSATPVKPKKAAKAKSLSAASAGKAAANNMVQQVLSKAKVDSPDIAFMASLVSKHTGQEKMKQTVYRATIAKFGQKRGLEIYNLVKSLLK